MDTMIALVKEKPEQGLWMREVPIPAVGKNDVKIKIKKTAICGICIFIIGMHGLNILLKRR